MIDKNNIEETISKASGKILLAGGYGVLEEGNFGLSLAINKHFYSKTSVEVGHSIADPVVVEVISPQIKGHWTYQYFRSSETITENSGQTNPFVENAVKYSMIYGLQKSKKNVTHVKVNVLFDRGFLSEAVSQKEETTKFLNYEGSPSKTGLGSSACVVVVIVEGILNGLFRGGSEEKKDLVNVLSQVANIAAQNKIGSNFDISTAVYGSQLYKNVLPKKCFEAVEKKTLSDILSVNPEIKKLVPNSLISNHTFSWLLDLRIGSNTRTMVSGFLKALQKCSIDIIEEFYSNNKLFVTQLYRLFCSDLYLCELVVSLKALNREYRRFLQKYSQITQVPVEPPEFKELLDEISSLEGVIYSICPGSGGYDAIAVIAITQQPKKLELSLSQTCKKRNVDCQVNPIKIEWQATKCSPQEAQQIEKYLIGVTETP